MRRFAAMSFGIGGGDDDDDDDDVMRTNTHVLSDEFDLGGVAWRCSDSLRYLKCDFIFVTCAFHTRIFVNVA